MKTTHSLRFFASIACAARAALGSAVAWCLGFAVRVCEVFIQPTDRCAKSKVYPSVKPTSAAMLRQWLIKRQRPTQHASWRMYPSC
jgi:hypothetical protein